MSFGKMIRQRLVGEIPRCVKAYHLSKLVVSKVRSSAAILLDHVDGIVLFSSDKKVGGICAGGIVAFVENGKTIWNWAVRKFPGNSVSKIVNGFSVNLLHKENAVTKGMGFSKPTPAPTGLHDLGKKSFFHRDRAGLVIAGLASASSYLRTIAAGLFNLFPAIRTPFNYYPAHVDTISNMEVS